MAQSRHHRRTHRDRSGGKAIGEQGGQLGRKVRWRDQLVELLEVGHAEPTVTGQVAALERGVPRHVDIVMVDPQPVEDLVLVVEHTIEGELEAAGPDHRPQALRVVELEAHLFGQLTTSGVLRGLTGVDAAARGVPHRGTGSLWVTATQQEHAVAGVDHDDAG